MSVLLARRGCPIFEAVELAILFALLRARANADSRSVLLFLVDHASFLQRSWPIAAYSWGVYD